jgi:hypothetical protein
MMFDDVCDVRYRNDVQQNIVVRPYFLSNVKSNKKNDDVCNHVFY